MKNCDFIRTNLLPLYKLYRVETALDDGPERKSMAEQRRLSGDPADGGICLH